MFHLVLAKAYDLRSKVKDLVFVFPCIELGALVQHIGKARCIGTLN